MTRTDLLNKKVDKLNNTSEALELISLLNYGECIAALMNTKNIPSEIHAALMKRGKRRHNARACNSWYAERSKRVNKSRAAAAAYITKER